VLYKNDLVEPGFFPGFIAAAGSGDHYVISFQKLLHHKIPDKAAGSCH
jgi:hypothetical protein